MNCELLCIGTELLLGDTVNTNAADVAVMLSELGINVYWHSVVGDNPKRLAESVELAKSRADLIITIGGLGPTYDDLSKNVVAECFGKKLVYRTEEAEKIRRWFCDNHSAVFTDNNLQQAYLPEDCIVLDNHWGTAPGCAFAVDGVHVLMLPGPPRECIPMFRECAMPYLRRLSEEVLVSRQIKVFGMGESAVEAMLRDEMKTMKNPSLATYAKTGEVMLRVTAKAKTEAEAAAMCEPVVTRVCDLLGDIVYGVDTDSLEACVLSLLREKHQTFSAAESLTGGLIGARFTAIPGASEVFCGGAVTYCDDVKAKLLGIDPVLIREKGAVSRDVAREMALGVRRVTGADIGVSATGLAGPDGDGVNPVGTVFVGLAAPDGVWVRHLRLGNGNRDRIRTISAHNAFDMMRRYLTGLPVVKEEIHNDL